MANSIIKAAAQGTLRGASKGGGMISAPFRAVSTVGHGVSNINKNIKKFRKKKI